MRLFFAVELPREVQRELGALRPAEQVAWGHDYRWVEPALMHLTLAFLGEQPPETLDVLREIGATTARASRPGTLWIGQPGAFGSPRAPRVLWVGLAGDLAGLHAAQARLAQDLRAAGFSLEDRAFSPHITLARRRPQASSGAPPAWPPIKPPARRAAPLDHLTLFESKLGPRGARYTPLEQFAFDAGPGQDYSPA